MTEKVLLPKNKINSHRKFLRNTNKYIFIIISLLIPLNIYIPYDKVLPNVLLTIDSSLSMSALDLLPNRSEYIYNLLNNSLTTLANKFTINSFDTNIHEFGKYINANQIPNELKKIRLWTGSGLGDALIYDDLLLSDNEDLLILMTDGSANVGFDHHQALAKIKKPIILVAINNTWYKIATDKNNQDIYISSDTGFINKILSDSTNTWVVISSDNQNIYSDWKILKQILENYNAKYQKIIYIYLNWILWIIWILQSLRFGYIYFRKSNK